MESREERLKKLIEAKQKIQNRNILPTVNKKDLDIIKRGKHGKF